MAFPFVCYYAKPGNYKSLYFGILIKKNLERNKKYYEKNLKIYFTDLEIYQIRSHELSQKELLGMKVKYPDPPIFPLRRKVALNMRLNPIFENEWKDYLIYYDDLEQLIKFRDLDLYIDEIATYLDSREFELMSRSVRNFLSQYRRLGICVYGNTQHWSMVDKRARLMFNDVFKMVKVLGNRDPSPTLPKINHIWGYGLVFPVENFESEDEKMMKIDFFGLKFFSVGSEQVELYNTREFIETRDYPVLKHIVRRCEHHNSTDPNHTCDFTKTIHM